MARKTAVKKASVKVPYEQMVLQAVVGLGSKDGSTAQRISKFIASKFKVGSVHSANVKMALRRATRSGKLVLSNGKFKMKVASKAKAPARKVALRKKAARRSVRVATKSRRTARVSVKTRRSKRAAVKARKTRVAVKARKARVVVKARRTRQARKAKVVTAPKVRKTVRSRDLGVNKNNILKKTQRKAAIFAKKAMKKCC